ncbi:MAG: histidine phosphatase family protein [Armatimonadota bacterium]
MIYLVRHGQTDWNVEKKTQGHTDIPLNDNGREQAKSLSMDISKLKIDRIISSDLLRARETAEIVNEAFGVYLTFDKRLREINYGDLEGILGTTLTPETWNIINTTPEKLNTEPFINVYTRIKTFFDELNDEHINILIVTHGDALRMIMYYANNRDHFDKEEYANFSQNVKIDNAAIFEWEKLLTFLKPVFIESNYNI